MSPAQAMNTEFKIGIRSLVTIVITLVTSVGGGVWWVAGEINQNQRAQIEFQNSVESQIDSIRKDIKTIRAMLSDNWSAHDMRGWSRELELGLQAKFNDSTYSVPQVMPFRFPFDLNSASFEFSVQPVNGDE